MWQYYLAEANSEQKRKVMKKIETEANDELRSEYDLKELRVRKVGPGWRRRGIFENCEASLKELRDDKLTFSSDIASGSKRTTLPK